MILKVRSASASATISHSGLIYKALGLELELGLLGLEIFFENKNLEMNFKR